MSLEAWGDSSNESGNCRQCAGTGSLEINGELIPCPRCDGTGFVDVDDCEMSDFA
jgi:DnaJ-class molecular chaperone